MKVLFLIILLASASVNAQDAPPSPKRTPSMSSDSGASSYRADESPLKLPKIGETVKLKVSGDDDDVPVANSLYSYEAYIQAALADDRQGMKDLLRNKDMILVKADVRALVLGFSVADVLGRKYPAVQVRILEGRYAKQSGWVSDKWLFFYQWIR